MEKFDPKKRFKDEKYPGVSYRIAEKIGDRNKTEKVYYVRYTKDGKTVEYKVGRQYKDNMTPAKANLKRTRFIDGRELPPVDKRKAAKAKKKAEANKYTIHKLWKEYKKSRVVGKSLNTDKGRYENYIKSPFGKKEPKDILALDVERLKRKLLKTKSPQTVAHILNLLTWIINYGTKNGLCEGLTFRITKPTVDNKKTEDLTQEQLKRLLKAIEKDKHELAGNIMLMALYSGMRRGEIFKLCWKHVDFDRGFITIANPKGGKSQKIPLNDVSRELLKSIPKKKGNPYVFPGRRKGKELIDLKKPINEIKKAAKLPDDFRPLHGLRHVYASMLASSGEVDMYTLQKLLTHKSPLMTQRYVHLRDEALKKASNIAGELFQNVANSKE